MNEHLFFCSLDIAVNPAPLSFKDLLTVLSNMGQALDDLVWSTTSLCSLVEDIKSLENKGDDSEALLRKLANEGMNTLPLMLEVLTALHFKAEVFARANEKRPAYREGKGEQRA